MMNKIILSILLLGLSACSSSPTSLNYYLLHEPGQIVANVATDISNHPTVYLRSLTTPDYLKQRNLSMQINDSELHFAPRHVWAEPFANDFKMALGEALSENHKLRLRAESKWTNPTQPEYILDIQLSDFIPTHHGNIILRGQYRLELDGATPLIVRFNFEQSLHEDGFTYAVMQMRELISKLANDIVVRVEANR